MVSGLVLDESTLVGVEWVESISPSVGHSVGVEVARCIRGSGCASIIVEYYVDGRSASEVLAAETRFAEHFVLYPSMPEIVLLLKQWSQSLFIIKF